MFSQYSIFKLPIDVSQFVYPFKKGSKTLFMFSSHVCIEKFYELYLISDYTEMLNKNTAKGK